jgi:Domain of unknown function (DUF1918)
MGHSSTTPWTGHSHTTRSTTPGYGDDFYRVDGSLEPGQALPSGRGARYHYKGRGRTPEYGGSPCTQAPVTGIVIESRHVGQPRRQGEVIEVVPGNRGREHFRVRWDDGHESTYFPSSDRRVLAVVQDRRISPRVPSTRGAHQPSEVVPSMNDDRSVFWSATSA